MCLGKAYVTDGVEDELVANNIISVKVDGTRIILTTLFHEIKTLEAVIEHIDYANGKLKLRLKGE